MTRGSLPDRAVAGKGAQRKFTIWTPSPSSTVPSIEGRQAAWHFTWPSNP